MVLHSSREPRNSVRPTLFPPFTRLTPHYHRVAKLDADDLSEIRWTAIEDPLLKPQGPTNLLAFWKRLTSKSGLGDDASHRGTSRFPTLCNLH